MAHPKGHHPRRRQQAGGRDASQTMTKHDMAMGGIQAQKRNNKMQCSFVCIVPSGDVEHAK